MATSSRIDVQYWDSVLFISLLSGASPERIPVIQALLELNRRGALRIVVSTMTIAEVRPYPSDRELPEAEFQTAQALFESDRLDVLAVTPRIATEAARIGYEHPGLSPTDCVHIATALAARADALLTYDGAGRRRRQRHMLALDLRIGDPPLRIREPFVPRNLRSDSPRTSNPPASDHGDPPPDQT